MPDSRRHRSAAPSDVELFAPERIPLLARAVDDLSWLLTRGYPLRSALELVGNRFELKARQREAVGRSACSDATRQSRAARRVPPHDVLGQRLAIDAYNVLTTLESALGGGMILRGRDACLRDLASMHGTWRRVAESEPAILLVRDLLEELGAAACTWYLDAPVSNSGRLRGLIAGAGAGGTVAWEAELVADADAAVLAADGLAVSADRRVLDGSGGWFDLASALIPARVPQAWIVNLGG